MDQKTISWVSYLTLIGWIIALVSYNSATDKSSLAKISFKAIIWCVGYRFCFIHCYYDSFSNAGMGSAFFLCPFSGLPVG